MTIPSINIKIVNVLTATFVTMSFFLDFISFAAVLIVFALYRIATRTIYLGDIGRAGIPAIAAIFVVGLMSTLALSPYPFSAWDVGKDLYLFLAPILMLVLGLTFIKTPPDFERVLTTSSLHFNDHLYNCVF